MGKLPGADFVISLARNYKLRIGLEPPDEEAAIEFWKDWGKKLKDRPEMSNSEIVDLLYKFFTEKRRLFPNFNLLKTESQNDLSFRSRPADISGMRTSRNFSDFSLETSQRLLTSRNLQSSRSTRPKSDLEICTLVISAFCDQGGHFSTGCENEIVQFWENHGDRKHLEISSFILTGLLSKYFEGEWFDLQTPFMKKFGYKPKDPSRLFEFWESANENERAEWGVRGFKERDILKFINKKNIAERALRVLPEKKEPGESKKGEISRSIVDFFIKLALPKSRKLGPGGRQVEGKIDKILANNWRLAAGDFGENTEFFYDALYCLVVKGQETENDKKIACDIFSSKSSEQHNFQDPELINPGLPAISNKFKIGISGSATVLGLELRLGGNLEPRKNLKFSCLDRRGKILFESDLEISSNERVLFEFAAVIRGYFIFSVNIDLNLMSVKIRKGSGLSNEAFKERVRIVTGKTGAGPMTLAEEKECRFKPIISSRARSLIRRQTVDKKPPVIVNEQIKNSKCITGKIKPQTRSTVNKRTPVKVDRGCSPGPSSARRVPSNADKLRARWGRLNRAKAFLSKGDATESRRILEDAFNLEEISRYFRCSSVGCGAAIGWADESCKNCSFRFCYAHRKNVHDCMKTPKPVESFDDAPTVALFAEVCNLLEIIDGKPNIKWQVLSKPLSSKSATMGASTGVASTGVSTGVGTSGGVGANTVSSTGPNSGAKEPTRLTSKEKVGRAMVISHRPARRMCLEWLENGSCSQGKACIHAHSPLDREDTSTAQSTNSRTV